MLPKLSMAVLAATLMLSATAEAQPPAAAPARAGGVRAPQPALRMDWRQTPYDAHGPLATESFDGGPACTIFRPVDLKPGTPVIIWGNGTTQKPVNYGPILDHLASYGFVVAAANTTNAGSGIEMLACLDWLTGENAKTTGAYAGKLDLTKVGAAGHSQGGGGTLMAGRDPRITATAPIMPYTKAGLGFVAGAQADQHGPMFLMSGGADTIAPAPVHQQPVYDGATVPVFWGTLANSSHLVPAQTDSGEFRPVLIAWMRYQLLGDRAAAALFTGPSCGLCSVPEWTVQRKGGL